MSCNCECHDHKPRTTGWRRFVPLIVGATVVGSLIAGAMLKDRGRTTTPGEPRSAQTNSATRY